MDAAVSLYAVYHLIRPAKSRPPLSSASYHFFALFTDAGLIPFYVFVAMFAQTNWALAPGTSGRWRTMFTRVDGADTRILLATFLTTATSGGLHLISVFLDLWLVLLFRRIAGVSPDSNPLEDNLTSRMASKHKHKSSDLSSMTMIGNEKKLSNMSGSTLNLTSPSRISVNKDYSVPDPNARIIPFNRSRNQSNATFQQTEESARAARAFISDREGFYQQGGSARTSRADMNRPESGQPRPRSQSRPRSQVAAFVGQREPMPVAGSFASARPDAYSRHNSPQPQPPSPIKNHPKKEKLLNDNWYVMVDDLSAPTTPQKGLTPGTPYDGAQQRADSYFATKQVPQQSHPLPLSSNAPQFDKAPTRFSYEEVDDDKNDEEDIGRAMTMGSSVYSDTASIKSEKRRYYGDLQAATMGIRGFTQAEVKRPESPPKSVYQQQVQQAQYQQPYESRVVSRTGVDMADSYEAYLPANYNNRNVSGRGAEEGRVGWHNMRKREVSGLA